MKAHYATVGEIRRTTLSAREETPAYQVVLRFLETGLHGIPVVNAKGDVVGEVGEIDLLKALMEGKDLERTPVGEIMAPCPLVIDGMTPLEEAAHRMMEHHLLRIPVVDQNNRLLGTITRRDLLRGWVGGLGLTKEAFWR